MRWPIPLGVLLLWILVGGLYAPGLTSGWHFDDLPNLNGLSHVTQATDIAGFVNEGRAGPLGRPISLLSFALQADAWPERPVEFLLVNLSLHLISGGLLFGLVHSLTRHLPNSNYISLTTAGLWLLCPLLASSSFLIVQRMTLLSGLFTLAGLWAYIECRKIPHLLHNLVSAGLVLALFGGLAAFSKENGLLLPLYALVLELFWLVRYQSQFTPILGLYRVFWLGLSTPLLVLIIYFIYNLDGVSHGYLIRDYTLLERLQTQLVILWDYLAKALLPRANNLGPFHDDYPVRSGVVVLAAGLAWLMVVLLSIVLRKKYPLLGLVVFWYLAGHLLESSYFPLELYFEHRNYIALIGVFFVLSVLAFSSLVWSKVGGFIIVLFALLNASVLYQVSNNWGQPLIGAIVWQQAHPQSIRATQFLADQYIKHGLINEARQLLTDSAQKYPENGLTLQALQLNCSVFTRPQLTASWERSVQVLHTIPRQGSVLSALDDLLNQVQQRQCALTLEQLLALSHALLQNQKITKDVILAHGLHHYQARLYEQLGYLNETMLELEAAFSRWPRAETVFIAVNTLLSAGLIDQAQQWLDKAERYPSVVRQSVWQKNSSALRAMIDAQRTQHQ